MTAKVIVFNKIGYDSFIDFLKAYAIICVILAHNFPTYLWKYCFFQVWADMQVPLFVLIQVFHAYKKGSSPTIKWQSLFNRIIIPFVVIQGIILLYRIIESHEPIRSILISSVIGGGNGPGSYYFWIYLQFTFILVFLWPLVKKISRIQLTWLFLLISVGCEILFSIIDLPSAIYRLLSVRYLFLIPLAFLWINEGVNLNFKNVSLSLLSIAAVYFFSFYKIDLEPFFYNTSWSIHRWICYYYLPILLAYGLWLIYRFVNKYDFFSRVFKIIAKSSYEIYLIQMMVFVFFPFPSFISFESIHIRLLIWMIMTFSLSICGGIILNRFSQRVLLRKKMSTQK